jgi:hypothetical protein
MTLQYKHNIHTLSEKIKLTYQKSSTKARFLPVSKACTNKVYTVFAENVRILSIVTDKRLLLVAQHVIMSTA